MEGGGWIEDAQVLSEVHLESRSSCSVSCFTIRGGSEVDANQPQVCEEPSESAYGPDESGDLVLPRKRSGLPPARSRESILIYHTMATSIPRVGLQVWRGALLLADFIIHKVRTSSEFQDVEALELGAGTGLAGIVLARQAKLVFITDRDAEILDNCSRNVFANCESFKHGEAAVRVRELDWKQQWPPNSTSQRDSYSWSNEDISDLENVTVFIAADVIYSDDLTDAFFEIVGKLLHPGSNKVLYLGLEKRYNFSINEMDVVANGYANFLRYLSVEGNGNSLFLGKRQDMSTIPQSIQEYERGTDLELWEIRPRTN